MPSLGNLLLDRCLSPANSWVVVFKSLQTIHHLMCYGNERFSQYLASAPDVGLSSIARSFVDKTNTPGGTEMSVFVRRYASYILARIASYRSQGYDFAKVKRSAPKEAPKPHPQASSFKAPSAGTTPVLRDLPLNQILEVLPRLQAQVDCLLDFNATENDLKNGVIRGAFLLLFRDLVRLFASFNDCIISLLEKFFSLKDIKVARQSFTSYVDFTERMDRIEEFLKIAEAIGVEKGEIPDLAHAPATLLNHMEGHCLVLEGKDPTEVLNRPPPVKKVKPPPVVPPAPAPSATAFNPFAAAPPEATGGVNPFAAVPTHAAPPPIPASPFAAIPPQAAAPPPIPASPFAAIPPQAAAPPPIPASPFAAIPPQAVPPPTSTSPFAAIPPQPVSTSPFAPVAAAAAPPIPPAPVNFVPQVVQEAVAAPAVEQQQPTTTTTTETSQEPASFNPFM